MTKKNWMKQKIQLANAHQYKASTEINELVISAREGKKIYLLDGSELTEFISCSYLGLDQDPRLIRSASENLENYGISFHAARTRVQLESNIELESLLNKLYCERFSLTFPSVHMAHLGFLPLLASGEMPSFPLTENIPLFILDKTAHVSIQINRGLMEQFGEVVISDFQRLETLTFHFKQAFDNNQTPIAIGDSIGSMGGVAPVAELIALADKYKGYVYLDDAHGTSVHGIHGCGYALTCLNYQFHPRLVIAATLGKAFGTMGGALVLPTEKDWQFLKRFCTTYTFGGPLALPVVSAAIAAAKIHLSDEIYTLQQALWENVSYFDAIMPKHLIVNAHIRSPIRGIFTGNEFEAIQYAKELRARGFAVTTAMYPTVPKGKSMLRAALSVKHSKQDISLFCDAVKEVFMLQSENSICF